MLVCDLDVISFRNVGQQFSGSNYTDLNILPNIFFVGDFIMPENFISKYEL